MTYTLLADTLSPMNYIFTLLILISTLHSNETRVKKPIYTASEVPKHMSVATKKRRFFYLVVPEVTKAYYELTHRFRRIKKDLETKTNSKEIKNLKKIYKVKSDKDLLLAIKPHPRSIVIAQAAIESNWGTSRFFREANNIFGMWSTTNKEARIAAKVKRGGTQTIWLKKFKTLEESVLQYYITIGRGKHYKAFRKLRYHSDNVFELVKKLDKYSEMGEVYTKSIARVIRHNNLTKYDKWVDHN